jgi:hypothetical protein
MKEKRKNGFQLPGEYDSIIGIGVKLALVLGLLYVVSRIQGPVIVCFVLSGGFIIIPMIFMMGLFGSKSPPKDDDFTDQ